MIIKKLEKLSSTAYDRNLEKERHIAVDYLVKAKINPKPMVISVFQLAQESNLPFIFSWMFHPESEERAKYILNNLNHLEFKSKRNNYN
jgi:hypothetical protein